jgi:hypothetical protein
MSSITQVAGVLGINLLLYNIAINNRINPWILWNQYLLMILPILQSFRWKVTQISKAILIFSGQSTTEKYE